MAREEVSLNDFVKAWQGHIHDLGRLKWYLSTEERNELDVIQEELKDLLAKAVKDLDRRRQVSETTSESGVEEVE